MDRNVRVWQLDHYTSCDKYWSASHSQWIFPLNISLLHVLTNYSHRYMCMQVKSNMTAKHTIKVSQNVTFIYKNNPSCFSCFAFKAELTVNEVTMLKSCVVLCLVFCHSARVALPEGADWVCRIRKHSTSQYHDIPEPHSFTYPISPHLHNCVPKHTRPGLIYATEVALKCNHHLLHITLL